MKQALLIIDMQHDNFTDSNMTKTEAQVMLDHTNQIITYAKTKGMPIYIIEHISRNPASTLFLTGTKGAQTHAEIDTAGTTTIIKHYPSSFRETKLQECLNQKGITELIISGAMTHMCIDTTVRAGNDLGYNITLVSDACFTKDLTFGDRVVKAADVQVSYMAALEDGFCKMRNTIDFIEN
jgi:nicotinamidase-related amidase